MNKTLLNMIRSMMVHIALPITFWYNALLTVTHTLNYVPYKLVNFTHYEL